MRTDLRTAAYTLLSTCATVVSYVHWVAILSVLGVFTCGTVVGTPYSVINYGKCSDASNRARIRDKASCDVAARSLAVLGAGESAKVISHCTAGAGGCCIRDGKVNFATDIHFNGGFHNGARGVCATAPDCVNTDGTVENNATMCKCGDNVCTENTGFFCFAAHSFCSSSASCANTDGSAPNAVDCRCGTTVCRKPLDPRAAPQLAFACHDRLCVPRFADSLVCYAGSGIGACRNNTLGAFGYSIINYGKCSDVPNRARIRDKASCDVAARSLAVLGAGESAKVISHCTAGAGGCCIRDGKVNFATDIHFNGGFHNGAKGVCATAPDCVNTDGTVENNATMCKCGDNVCTENTGFFCYQQDGLCRKAPLCAFSQETAGAHQLPWSTNGCTLSQTIHVGGEMEVTGYTAKSTVLWGMYNPVAPYQTRRLFVLDAHTDELILLQLTLSGGWVPATQDNDGGFIKLSGGARVNMTNVIISGCGVSAPCAGTGGAIAAHDSWLEIFGSTFLSNSAADSISGAILITGSSRAHFKSTNFSQNSGAVLLKGSARVMLDDEHNTFFFNGGSSIRRDANANSNSIINFTSACPPSTFGAMVYHQSLLHDFRGCPAACLPGSFLPGYARRGALNASIVCTACPAGYYSPNPMIHENCTKCPHPSSTIHEGATSVDQCCMCAPGTILLASEPPLRCQPCGAGRYQDKLPTDLSIRCLDCPAGRYLTDNHTLAPEHDHVSDCKNCPVGFEYAGAEVACKVCAAGRYQNDSKSDELRCKRCPAGYFIGDKGKLPSLHGAISDCDPCPEGQVSSPGAGYCISCQAGWYASSLPLQPCVQCPSGWKSDGASDCAKCVPGRYQTEAGKPFCLPCLPGEYQALAGQSECARCPTGWFQRESDQDHCERPPSGTIAAGAGAVTVEIADGWHAVNCTDDGVCTKTKRCAMGTRSTDNKKSCAMCEPGKTSPMGASECQICEVGKHAPHYGTEECRPCNRTLKQYADAVGMARCKVCRIAGQISSGTECQEPAVDPDLPVPSNVRIELVDGSSNHIRVVWLLPPGPSATAAGNPHSFEVRISVDADFSTTGTGTRRTASFDCSAHATGDGFCVLESQHKSLLRASSVLRMPDLHHKLLYAKVRSSLAGRGNSDWSGTSAPWSTADACADDEYLDTLNATANPLAWVCKKCPKGSSCRGAILWAGVKPKFGWARCPENRSRFEACIFGGACLGGPNDLLVGKYDGVDPLRGHNESCFSPGYRDGSRLCSSCAEGYSHRDLTGRCDSCPDMGSNMGLALLGVVASLVGTCIYVRISIADAGQFDVADGVKSIGLSFLHVLSMLTTFPIAWPPIFTSIFRIGGAVTVLGKHLVNLKCMFPLLTEAEVFYLQLGTWALLPLIMVGLNCAIWCLLASRCCRNRSRFAIGQQHLLSRIRTSSVALLYLVWPSLASETFTLFSCASLCETGKSYFRVDLEEQCFAARHGAVVVCLGLPMVLVYVLGLPSVALLMVRRLHLRAAQCRMPVETLKGHITWSMFYAAFDSSVWFWESTISLRKVSVAMIGVFGTNMLDMQVPAASLILIVFMLLTALVRPYGNQHTLHGLEVGSLVTLFLTLWAGLVFNAHPKCTDGRGGTLLWCDALSMIIGIFNAAFMVALVAFFLYLKGTCSCVKHHLRLSKPPRENPDRESAMRPNPLHRLSVEMRSLQMVHTTSQYAENEKPNPLVASMRK